MEDEVERGLVGLDDLHHESFLTEPSPVETDRLSLFLELQMNESVSSETLLQKMVHDDGSQPGTRNILDLRQQCVKFVHYLDQDFDVLVHVKNLSDHPAVEQEVQLPHELEDEAVVLMESCRVMSDLSDVQRQQSV